MGSKLVVLQNVGHAPMEETPSKVAAAICAFLNIP
jgi:pimeloyl-ACP methyl ester carboxylesterase